jgi:hypothetical protein
LDKLTYAARFDFADPLRCCFLGVEKEFFVLFTPRVFCLFHLFFDLRLEILLSRISELKSTQGFPEATGIETPKTF